MGRAHPKQIVIAKCRLSGNRATWRNWLMVSPLTSVSCVQ